MTFRDFPVLLAAPLLVAVAVARLAADDSEVILGPCIVCSTADVDKELDCSNCCGVIQSCNDTPGTFCHLGEPWRLSDCWQCPVDVGGWTQVGYHTNDSGLFNMRPHQVQLHQQWLYFEKAAEADCRWDWGFRTDAVYGTDGQDYQAFFGSPSWFDSPWDTGRDYGWALPQVYLEIAAENLSVVIGRFYTLIGYEYGTAPDDFFYSHTYTFFYAEPFTHTGVLATYKPSEQTEVSFGWVDGWDTAFEFTGGSQFLGGISQSVGEKIQVLYAVLVGQRERGLEHVGGGHNHSFVIQAELTDKLLSVLQCDLTDYARIDHHDRGINQRFIYTINDCLAFGSRVEWWHTSAEGGTSSDIYALTLGMNLRPHASLVFRPEVRWDWNRDGALGIAQAGLGEPVNGLGGDMTFAIDTVFVY